jgi:hypothetical protein
MDCLDFSPEVSRLLLANGWSAERYVEIDPVIWRIAKSGHRLNDCARRFLENMHGLTIRVWLTDVDCALWMTFDVREMHFYRWTAQLSSIFELEVCPIGTCLNGNLYLAPDGQVVGDCRACGHGYLWRSRSVNEELDVTFLKQDSAPYELVVLDQNDRPVARKMASWVASNASRTDST